jgi:hypothetical protein
MRAAGPVRPASGPSGYPGIAPMNIARTVRIRPAGYRRACSAGQATGPGPPHRIGDARWTADTMC